MNNESSDLDQLFAAYREACEPLDAGPNFMPQIWARIESQSTFSFVFTRYARLGSLAAGLVCVVLLVLAHVTSLGGTTTLSNYADALAADQSAEKSSYAETIVADSHQIVPVQLPETRR